MKTISFGTTAGHRSRIAARKVRRRALRLTLRQALSRDFKMHGGCFEVARLSQAQAHRIVGERRIRLQFDGFVQVFHCFGAMLQLILRGAHGELGEIEIR